MACTQTFTGILRDCTPSMGGVVKAWVENFDEVVVKKDEEGRITSIEGEFKPYELRRETGALTSTITTDPKTHTRFVTSEVTLVFAHMDNTKRDEIEKLIAGDLAVILQDANGKYWYLGATNPVNVSAGTGQTGTAAGDSNNYTLTLQDVDPNLPQDVSAMVDQIGLS